MVLNVIENEKAQRIKMGLTNMGAEGVEVYSMDTGCIVIYSVENGREHVSVAHPKRYPNWNELTFVRYKIMKKDVRVAQILPPRDEYINAHENCFHLWEMNEDELIQAR